MVSLKRMLLVLLLIVLWMGCKSLHADGVLEGGSKFVRMKDGEDTAALAKIIDDKIPVDCDRARNGDHAYVTIRLYAKHEDMINLCHNYFHSNLVNPIPGHQGYGAVPPVMPFQPGYVQPIQPGMYSTSPDPLVGQPFPGAPFYAQQHSIPRPVAPFTDRRELQPDMSAPQMTQDTNSQFAAASSNYDMNGDRRQLYPPQQETYESQQSVPLKTTPELDKAEARIAELEQELSAARSKQQPMARSSRLGQANAHIAELQPQVGELGEPNDRATVFAARSNLVDPMQQRPEVLREIPRSMIPEQLGEPVYTQQQMDQQTLELQQTNTQLQAENARLRDELNGRGQQMHNFGDNLDRTSVYTEYVHPPPEGYGGSPQSQQAIQLQQANAELQEQVERLQSELSTRAQPMAQDASTQSTMDEKVSSVSSDGSDIPRKREKLKPLIERVQNFIEQEVLTGNENGEDRDPFNLVEFEAQVVHLVSAIDQMTGLMEEKIIAVQDSQDVKAVKDLKDRLMQIKVAIDFEDIGTD